MRVDASGSLPQPRLTELAPGGDPIDAIVGRQAIHLESGIVEAPIYARARLGAGARIAGPAIVTQLDATTLLLPRQSAEVHPTGSLIVRYGNETIIAIGLALLTACGLVALAGIDILNFWSALILLGIGWNFTFIGGTTMLTETYRPEEKTRVQGFNDMLVFGTAALGSFLAGSLFVTIGWAWLVSIIFPMVAIAAVLLASSWLARVRNRPGTA